MVTKNGATISISHTDKASSMSSSTNTPNKKNKGYTTEKDEQTNEKYYKCSDCGITKTNQSTMSMHVRKHKEEVNHICKVCKKGFLQKQTLDLHIRSKHPEILKENSSDETKFKCPFDNCEFSALTKGNCIIHCLRVHFQDEIREQMLVDNDTRIIYCNECDKDFSSPSAFYYHCKSCMSFEENNKKHTIFKELLA